MNELILAIRLQVDRMAALLQMSPEQCIGQCTIRELLLSIAHDAQQQEPPQPGRRPADSGSGPTGPETMERAVGAFAEELGVRPSPFRRNDYDDGD